MAQGPEWTEAQRAARLGHLVERNRSRHQGAHLYEDAAWMRSAYVDRNLTMRQIAAEAGCGVRTVARWLKIHEVESRVGDRRPARGEAHPKWKGGIPPCPTCGAPRAGYERHQRCRACFIPPSGEQNPNWRGDGIKNPQAHARVKKLRGSATEHLCSHCGGPAEEWAYDHADPTERSDPEGPYSLDPAHYMPLCKSCHRRFDRRS